MTRPAIEKRIFIVGAPRSGTTLVQSLLATHSAVTSFTESHFFSRHFRLIPGLETAILASDPRPRLRDFLAENVVDSATRNLVFDEAASQMAGPGLLRPLRTRVVAQQLLGVLDRLAIVRGVPNWVEKTVQHLRYIPFLEGLFGTRPAPHFVHVVREGRAVVASLLEASKHWQPRRYPFAIGPNPPYDVESCVRRWNTDVAYSLKREGAPNDHFVFYEELTADPQATLVRLLSGLGLEWEPALLVEYPRTSTTLMTEDETWKAGVRQEIRRKGPADHALTPQQEDQLGNLLENDLYTRLLQQVGGSRTVADRGKI